MTTARSAAPLGELARLGVQLRWRLVANRRKRMGKKTQAFAYGLAGIYALANIVGLASARFISASAGERTLVLLVSSMASGWIFGPILIGGVDETVDPTRLALLPFRARELFTVQLSAALTGVGPLGALVSLTIGATLGFAPLGPAAVVAPVAAVVTVVMIVGFARTVAAALAIAQRSRLGRDLSVIFAALVAGALFVVAQLATSFSGERAAELIDTLKAAPWAWPMQATIAARAGATGDAFLWLLAGAGAAGAALLLWSRLSQYLLTNGERVVRTGRRGRGAVLNGARGVFGAALARQWIYLRRAPKARVSLAFGVAFGVAFPVLQIIQHGADDSPYAAFSVLLAMLANIGATSNLLGYDASSLWMEVLANGPGRVHMAARSLMALPNLLLPTWLAAAVVGIWTGQWTYIALAALVALPVALLVLAQGLVTSVLGAWPLSDGDNPFGNKQSAEGQGARLATIALSGLGVSLVLSLPLILAAYLGRDQWWGWATPGVGLVGAAAVYALVVEWVGRRLDGHEPELVEQLSPVAVG